MENTKSNNIDKLSTFLSIVSNAIPPVGIYLYFKYRKDFPNKADKTLTNALIGIPIGLIGGYILQNYVFK